MPIWDDFGKKAGDAARTFGTRAKEVAETTKLNGQIAVKKTEAERIYGEIGKLFCSIRAGRSNDADELEALCVKVEQNAKELEQLQEQIDVIRQVRRCKNCGEISPNTSRFCGACGAKFEDEAPKAPAQPEAVAEPVAEEGVEITWPKADEPADKKEDGAQE